MNALISLLRRTGDRLLGRGEAAVTLPPMDGALLPNNALEQATVLASVPTPDNLAWHDGTLLVSSGNQLLQVVLEDGRLTPWKQFDAEVAATTSFPDGRLLVALASGQLLVVEQQAVRELGNTGSYRGFCPTALLAENNDDVIVVEGSSQHRCHQWQRDLMTHGRSGSVWRLQLSVGRATRLADGLAWPSGVARDAGGNLVVSESWRHRLRQLGGGPREDRIPLLDLPGYPGRLLAAEAGGYWLSLFAPRSQLVEFVLREKQYRERMITEIEEPFWVAPALQSGRDFRELLQGGAIKSMGILKPWAPTRSYGLLVQLDDQWQPRFSLHSRADGQRHGITSALEQQGRLLVASKGGGCILTLPGSISGEDL